MWCYFPKNFLQHQQLVIFKIILSFSSDQRCLFLVWSLKDVRRWPTCTGSKSLVKDFFFDYSNKSIEQWIIVTDSWLKEPFIQVCMASVFFIIIIVLWWAATKFDSFFKNYITCLAFFPRVWCHVHLIHRGNGKTRSYCRTLTEHLVDTWPKLNVNKT